MSGYTYKTLRIAVDRMTRGLWRSIPYQRGERAMAASCGVDVLEGRCLFSDAPVVSGVFARGTAWNGTFLRYLGSHGMGDQALGYALPVGSGVQLKALPWSNVNRLSVRFSGPVVIDRDDLILTGINLGTYDVTQSTFSYDAVTFVATWTLPAAITADKLMVSLNADHAGGIVDAVGNRLDGEWTNPALSSSTGTSIYPSGDGTAGGDFHFRFNVLPGDVNQNSVVQATDGVVVRNQLNYGTATAGYSAYADLNGNGVIQATDGVIARDALNQGLPSGQPPAGKFVNAPVAGDDAYTTTEDTDLVVTGAGVQTNDSDADGDMLTAILVGGTSHGTLSLAGNGSFAYQPEANWSGTDSFTYKLTDGELESNVATVVITVAPVNDAPEIGPGSGTVVANEGSSASNSGTLFDADGDLLTLSASEGAVARAGSTWVWSATPADGPALHTVTITADDGHGGIQTTTFTLDIRNVAPWNLAIRADAGNHYAAGSPLSFVGWATDVSGDTISYSWTVTMAGQGSPVASGTGTGFIFTPGMAGTYTVWMTASDGEPNGTAQTSYQMVCIASDADRAASAAQDGIEWLASRFVANQAALPAPLQGELNSAIAWDQWGSYDGTANSMKTLCDMLNDTFILNGQGVEGTAHTSSIDHAIRSNPIPVSWDSSFTLTVVQDGSEALDPAASRGDSRYLHIFSTGKVGGVECTLWAQFEMEKSIPFAYQGRVPLQIGKNVLIEGSVAISEGDTTGPDAGKTVISGTPCIQIISDFNYPTDRTGAVAALHTAAANFRTFLVSASGYGSSPASWQAGNRIPVPSSGTSSTICANAVAAGWSDLNDDGFIDEYDVAIKVLGASSSFPYAVGQLSGASSIDPALQEAIDNLGAPWATETARPGFNDAIIDNRDNYAKIRGNVYIEYPYISYLMQYLDGPIVAPVGTQAVTMGTAAAHADWSPATFAGACTQMASESGTNAGMTVVPASVLIDSPATAKATIQNKTLSVNDLLYGDVKLKIKVKGTTPLTVGNYYTKAQIAAANAGKITLTQATVFDSFGPTAASQITDRNVAYYKSDDTTGGQTYNRPVFKNMKFVNVTIPQGLNAYFENCEFSGVTYVDYATYTGTASTAAAATWASGSASVANTSPLYYMGKVGSGSGSFTRGSTTQNNLMFADCTFTGPLAAACPDQQTARYNQWNFIGATSFDNVWLDPDGCCQTTATIMAPQTVVDMGSLLSPGAQTVNMKGLVVAAVIDIRASGRIDGSIVSTIKDTWGGNWHSNTLGYFGPSDTWGTPSFATPLGGLGSLVIRQNPDVPLPYGIAIPLRITAETSQYQQTSGSLYSLPFLTAQQASASSRSRRPRLLQTSSPASRIQYGGVGATGILTRIPTGSVGTLLDMNQADVLARIRVNRPFL